MNRLLAAQLALRFTQAGVGADLDDQADHPMPIYHGDDEVAEGPPATAVALHDLLAAADGLIVVTPEYNGGPPALLKNSLDWVTRVDRAVFRRLLQHLDERKDVQNIDLMNLAGFCRNCLSKWYVAAAQERGLAIDYDEARERVYGMPYDEWKARYQTEATAEQKAAFEAAKPD